MGKLKRATSLQDDSSESESWSISQISNAKIPRGLHCGPSGRKALVKWLEDNYRTGESDNPAVEACKVWQETQGFRDEVCKGFVGLLKLLGLPRNTTYKILFSEYLSRQFLDKIDRDVSQKDLMNLAKRMINMFQVRQVQPLFAAVLSRLDEIPDEIMGQIVDDTPWANDFYNICNFKLKQKIWKYRPERFHERVSPILRKIALLLSSETTGLAKLFDHNRVNELSDLTLSKILQNPISFQLSQLAEIIGKPGPESYNRYDLLIKSIRFEFLNSCKSERADVKNPIYCGYYSLIRLIFLEYYQKLHPNENSKIYEPKSGFIGFILLILNLGPNNPKVLNLLKKKIMIPIDEPNATRYRVLDENDLFEVSMLFSSPHILMALTTTLGQSLCNILDTGANSNIWLGFLLLGIASPHIGYSVKKLNGRFSRDLGGFNLGKIIEYIIGQRVSELDPNMNTLNSLQRFIVEVTPLLDVNGLASLIKSMYEYIECENYTISQIRERFKISGSDEECRSAVLTSISREIFKFLGDNSDKIYGIMSRLLLMRIISVAWLRKSGHLVEELLANYIGLRPGELLALEGAYLISGIMFTTEFKLYQPGESTITALLEHFIRNSQDNLALAMTLATFCKYMGKFYDIKNKSQLLKSPMIAEMVRSESLESEWEKLN